MNTPKEDLDNLKSVAKSLGHTGKNRSQIRKMKAGRNETCPCNSGKKFKKCCYRDDRKP